MFVLSKINYLSWMPGQLSMCISTIVFPILCSSWSWHKSKSVQHITKKIVLFNNLLLFSVSISICFLSNVHLTQCYTTDVIDWINDALFVKLVYCLHSEKIVKRVAVSHASKISARVAFNFPFEQPPQKWSHFGDPYFKIHFV